MSKRKKSDNTFVFKSFHQLIDEIQISAIKFKTELPQVDEEEHASYLGESIKKWKERNCTLHFNSFCDDLGREVETLLQVIHHQDRIVKCLQKHLEIENSLALEPLIDIVTQLSRDLQSDFYSKYFESFVRIFFNLLAKYHHDVEVIKCIFVAFSFLFKFLSKEILHDIENIYKIFLILLSPSYKDYINNFMAEAFSFLIRKHKNPSFIIKIIFSHLNENPQLGKGVSLLLFETIKGLKYQFHSNLKQIMTIILDHLPVMNDLEFSVIKELFNSISMHTNSRYSTIIIRLLTDRISKLIIQDCRSDFVHQMQLLHTLIKYKDGHIIDKNDANHIAELLCDLLRQKLQDEDINLEIFNAASLMLSFTKLELAAYHRPTLIRLVYEGAFDFQLVYNFTQKILEISLFETVCII